MYKQVAKTIPVAKMYEQELISEGTVTPDEVATMKNGIVDLLEEAYKKSKNVQYKSEDWMTEQWE
jgi:2-oxoglutarate dehydrogenase E1 component